MQKIGHTSLPDGAYSTALVSVRKFLRTEKQITNAKLRSLTGLNYDQAIKFFNSAIANKELVRRGKASGTHYVLP